MAIDAELVEQIRHGNQEAYGELFRKYYAQIYSLCLSILNNPQDAEDVAQEMFIYAYLKLDVLRKPDSFFPWLKKIAQNRSRDLVRQSERRKAPLSLPVEHINTATPDDKLLRQELMQAIMEAIEALPEKDRQVIKARIDGLSHAEISRRFDISYQASLSRLYRSRRKLADHLKDIFSAFGLARFREVISGGIVAMKIGTGAKVTIGVIGVLAAGFITFQIATNQPEQEVSPADQVIQEPSAKSLETPGTVQQKPAGKEIQAQADSAAASSDSPKESVSAEEVEEFLAILDQMDKAQDSEESVAESSIPEDNRLILEMPFGTIKFDPPYWSVDFNPTLEEMKRLDEIEEELKKTSIGDDEREALLAEKEYIMETAKRPTRYISGTIISKEGAEVPAYINWGQLYDDNFPDD